MGGYGRLLGHAIFLNDQFIDIARNRIVMERSSSCFWNWPMADQNKGLGSCSSDCGGWVMVGITSEYIACISR